jgi:hypothetical protein
MSAQNAKRSSEEMAKAIESQHQDVLEAAQNVLGSAGLEGVKVHLVQYSIEKTAMSSSPCQPPCSAGQTCAWVIGPEGGRWECV